MSSPHHSNSPRWREKIVKEGVESLRTHELLAVILGSGIPGFPVEMLALKVDELFRQNHLSLDSLLKIKGLGLAKACQMVALSEFVERLRPLGTPVLDSLEKVLEQVNELRFFTREHIVCLYLNTRLQLVMKETLAIGGLNQAAITPRDIFAVIRQFPVHNFILVHNHPSGDPTPSAEDVQFTQNIHKAGQLLGVELLDHIVVSKTSHYSFTENGKI